MFLSRIWLNPRRQATRAAVVNPQRLHAAVLAAFPTQTETQRLLWRLDLDDPFRLGLLLVSADVPSLEHVVEQFGWPSSSDRQAETRPYRTFLDSLTAGQEYAFRLTANPVQSVAKRDRGERVRGKPVPLTTRVQQTDWILERSQRAGFTIRKSAASQAMGDDTLLDLLVTRPNRIGFRKGQGSNTQRVTLHTVTYEGTLTVDDPVLLRAAMTDGIGRAKAYGCGLLTLAALAQTQNEEVADVVAS